MPPLTTRECTAEYSELLPKEEPEAVCVKMTALYERVDVRKPFQLSYS